MRLQKSIYIGRPAEEVFAFIADHSNDHRWRGELLSSHIVSDVCEGVGTHLRQAVSYRGRTAEANFEVTEFEPGRRICFRARGRLRAHGCYDVQPEGSGTRLTVSATVELKGEEAMLERYFRQVVEQAAWSDLEQLRLLLESDEPV